MMGTVETEPTERHEELFRMSEVAEKEIELVAGAIKGIIQKGTDKWQVEVQPNGSQFTKKLWTKDSELVQALSQKIGEAGAFVCGVSHWTNQDGKPVRSLWIDNLSDGTENIAAPRDSGVGTGHPPSTIPAHASSNNEGMSKEEWRRKDSAADKRALTAIAVSALTHTMPSEPTDKDLDKFLERVDRLVLTWHGAIARERDELPFQ